MSSFRVTREFELEDWQNDKLVRVSRDNSDGRAQTRANSTWRMIGLWHGCEGHTARPSQRGGRFFTAEVVLVRHGEEPVVIT